MVAKHDPEKPDQVGRTAIVETEPSVVVHGRGRQSLVVPLCYPFWPPEPHDSLPLF